MKLANRPAHSNFHTPGTRYCNMSAPTVEYVITSAEGDIARVLGPDGIELPRPITELERDRQQRRIDFKLDEEPVSRMIARRAAQILGLSETRYARFERTVDLCVRVEQARHTDTAPVGSIRAAVKAVLDAEDPGRILRGRRSTTSTVRPLLGPDDLPSEDWLRKLHRAYLAGDYLAIAQYGSRDADGRGILAHPRAADIWHDVLLSGMEAESPGHHQGYSSLRAMYVEQRKDEIRLLELGFVRSERGVPEGPRSERVVARVHFDRLRQLCVAVGIGGDVFYRPCQSAAMYAELLDRLLEPAAGTPADDPRWDNNLPSYREERLLDSVVAALLRERVPDGYAEQLVAARAAKAIPAMGESTVYGLIQRLPDFYRSALVMGSQQHRLVKGMRLGHERPARVDTELQGDMTPLDVLVADDDRQAILGRLRVAAFADTTSDYIAGIGIDLGGESVAIFTLALAMALSSKYGLKERLNLRHELIPGRKPFRITFDYGGVFRGSNASRAFVALDLPSSHSQKGSPKYKAEIERDMSDINTPFHELPGSTQSDTSWQERYRYNPKKDVIVTISAAVRMVYRTLFDGHNHNKLPSLGGLTPHDVYVAGRKTNGTEYDPSPPDHLLDAFLAGYYPVHVTPSGILIEGIPFRFPEESEEYRHLLGRPGLLATLHPWRLGEAHLVDPLTKDVCKLCVNDSFASLVEGRSLWQVHRVLDERKRAITTEDRDRRRLWQRQHGRDAVDESLAGTSGDWRLRANEAPDVLASGDAGDGAAAAPIPLHLPSPGTPPATVKPAPNGGAAKRRSRAKVAREEDASRPMASIFDFASLAGYDGTPKVKEHSNGHTKSA